MSTDSTEGPTSARQVMMSDDMWEAIRVAAFEKRVSMSELVRAAIARDKPLQPYLAEQEELRAIRATEDTP